MLMRWEPFFGMNRYQNDYVDRMYAARRRAHARPAVDISENETAYSITLEVPGVARDQISVEVNQDVLTVRGDRKTATDEEKGSMRRVERSQGSFARSFSLPDDANADAIEAKLHEGLLELTIPRRARPTARAIEVKAA